MTFIFDNIYATISPDLKENLDFLSTDQWNGFEEIISQVCSITGVSYIETVPEKLYGAWNSVRDAHDMLLGVLLCKNIGVFDKNHVNRRPTDLSEISRGDNARGITLSESNNIGFKNAVGRVSRNNKWERSQKKLVEREPEAMDHMPAQTGSRRVVVDLSNTDPESSSNFENRTHSLPVPQDQDSIQIQSNNLSKDMSHKKDDNYTLKYQHCMPVEQNIVEKFTQIEENSSCENVDQDLSDNTMDISARTSHDHDNSLYSTDKEPNLSHQKDRKSFRVWKCRDNGDCGSELQKTNHGNICNTSRKHENSKCSRASSSQLVDSCSSVDKSNLEFCSRVHVSDRVSSKTATEVSENSNKLNDSLWSMKSRETSDEEENMQRWRDNSWNSHTCGHSSNILSERHHDHGHHQESSLDISTFKIKQEMEDPNEGTDVAVYQSNVTVMMPNSGRATQNFIEDSEENDRKETVTSQNSEIVESGCSASNVSNQNFSNSEQMPLFLVRNSDDHSAKFFCTSCCYSSNHYKQISDHMKRVHFKKFKCMNCPAKFGLQKDLTRHYRKTHKMFIECKSRGRQVNKYQ